MDFLNYPGGYSNFRSDIPVPQIWSTISGPVVQDSSTKLDPFGVDSQKWGTVQHGSYLAQITVPLIMNVLCTCINRPCKFES